MVAMPRLVSWRVDAEVDQSQVRMSGAIPPALREMAITLRLNVLFDGSAAQEVASAEFEHNSSIWRLPSVTDRC